MNNPVHVVIILFVIWIECAWIDVKFDKIHKKLDDLKEELIKIKVCLEK